MSFTPLSGGLSTALSGVVEPTKFMDFRDLNEKPSGLYERRMHGPSMKDKKNTTLKYTIIVVIISAVVFVTIISLYDIVRAYFNKIFATISLNNPESNNSPEAILRTQIANDNQFWSTLSFSAFCLITAVILIAIAIYIFHVV